jgi:hypothetical protein
MDRSIQIPNVVFGKSKFAAREWRSVTRDGELWYRHTAILNYSRPIVSQNRDIIELEALLKLHY